MTHRVVFPRPALKSRDGTRGKNLIGESRGGEADSDSEGSED